MRDLTKGQEKVQASGNTMRQVLAHLDEQFPGFRARIVDAEEDRIRPNIAVMIDGRSARMGLREQVDEHSEIHFLPAISGGA